MDFQESKEPLKEIDSRKYLTLTVSVFFALLSFFIMLNAVSTANLVKSGNLTKSIKQEFENTSLKQELQLFQKRDYDTGLGNYTKSFKYVVTEFLESVRTSINSELMETPENYIVKVKTVSLFGPNDNNSRAVATNFLLALNKFVDVIKKTDDVAARIVIPYDEASAKAASDSEAKIKSLYKIIEKEKNSYLKFSTSPVDVKQESELDKFNNIYIVFSKNEF
jgi:hypothetical protein